jgi:xanthine dehydrogenase YagS FAD-binding subunit
MIPFAFRRAENAPAAYRAFFGDAPGAAGAQYLAGGTTLLDLMKLDVMRPTAVVDIGGLRDPAFARIDAGPAGLRLGAAVRMAEAADHPAIKRDYPVIAQSLALAASQQIRNMATLGGNVLQRTRCPYFRDVSYTNCNKRNPGSGCAALDGVSRRHALLGTSPNCIATYPGDFAQALIALDAMVEIMGGRRGMRRMPFAELHRRPGDRPDIETRLEPGELIAGFVIPARPWYRRSLYLKIRDRESYEFALASVAVVLDLRGGTVQEARLALGGLATAPWRAAAAEAALAGKRLDDGLMLAAADAALAGATPRPDNEFRVRLAKKTVERALRAAAALEIAP